MPRSIWFATLSALLALATACQAAAPAASTSVPPTATLSPANHVRLTNGEFTPYLGEQLPHYGVASRIVSEAFALQGITVEYGFFPWARARSLAQEGTWDGSVVWHKTPEREMYFYFSDAVIDNQDVFFHLKSTAFDWQEVSDLAGLRVGGTLGYAYGTAFETAEQTGQITVERAATDEQNFQKLLAGRIDVFPLDLEVGLSLLREKFSPAEAAQITYHPVPLQISPFALMLSKKQERNVELLALFNAGLQELRESGRLQQIIDEARAGK